MQQNSRIFKQEMIELLERKERELNRRGNRANELLRKSEEFENNAEQWEAYQQCVKYQQDRMMSLIHDLFVIKSILERFRGDPT